MQEKQLEEIANKQPPVPTSRLAELLIARAYLGPEGIEQLASIQPESRRKAVENIEKARESFGKLLDLEMLLVGGYERTEAEYRVLAETAGFRLERSIALAVPQSILELIAT